MSARRIRIERTTEGDNGEGPLWWPSCGCRYVPTPDRPDGPIEFTTWAEAMEHVNDMHLKEEAGR